MRGLIAILAMFFSVACERAHEASVERAAPVGSVRTRLLSAHEYRNTVRDLLGIEASNTFSHGDATSGYHSGAGAKIDENLFAAFFHEAERLADAYVLGPLAAAYPCTAAGTLTEDCITTLVDQLGLRTYRRPLQRQELAQHLALYRRVVAESGDPSLGIKSVIARMLVSLHFLYRTELGVSDGLLASLTPYERASVISYASTGSMPDAELLDGAARGDLVGEGIERHVRRLLVTSAGQRQIVRFVGEWLRVDGVLRHMASGNSEFPKLASAAQGQALHDEFYAYVIHALFSGGGTLGDLLTGDRTFINQHSAPLYGATRTGDTLKPFFLGDQRRGVLSLASVMAAHANAANPEKDRPVIRGLLVKERFLCDEIGLPSGLDTATAAEAVIDDIENFEQLTTREQFTAIMNQAPHCQDCHQQFVPFGFMFGQFGGLGQFRARNPSGRRIDVSANDIPIADGLWSFQNHLELIDYLASSPLAHQCFVRNLVTYVTGTTRADVINDFALRLHRTGPSDIPSLLAALLSSPELYRRTLLPSRQEGAP